MNNIIRKIGNDYKNLSLKPLNKKAAFALSEFFNNLSLINESVSTAIDSNFQALKDMYIELALNALSSDIDNDLRITLRIALVSFQNATSYSSDVFDVNKYKSYPALCLVDSEAL